MSFFIVSFKNQGTEYTALVRGEVEADALRSAWLLLAQSHADDYSKVEDDLVETTDEELANFGFCEDNRAYRSRFNFNEATEITAEQYQVLYELSDKLALYV
ncbi:TPA: hypothetical protein ACJEU7_002587 [Acinetobacter baumannii]|uniref:hypothetical protein n=1 Tax=Acinetobacter baumannii TaxID=470 RepID=UPI00124A8460|nr:hypothetical protein [Acinetobacter baumannii]KAB1664967.1 hypothetical protein F8B05_19825 [Acinetobacter baumannii]MCX3034071.1 hypothetical protein [Acinetobacter baumannii]